MGNINRPVGRAVAFAIVCAAQSQFAQAQAASAAEAGLEEVVVTAQFREQKLQDTPIAITAVTAEMLEARNQTSLAVVAAQAPNVNLRETGGAFGPGMSAEIRGVGQRDFNPAFEPGVGIYIDDVYYSSLTGANFDLLDLDRVEIARGPQGVLGGRNSEGGSIKLYSQKPRGDDSGAVRFTYGSRTLLDLRAVGDFSVTDTLALRISGVSRKQDGYVKRYDFGCLNPTSGIPYTGPQGDCFIDKLGGKNYTAGRAALRWSPSDSLDINFSADLTSDSSPSAAIVLQDVNPAAGGALFTNTFGVPYDDRFVPSNPYVNYGSMSALRPQNLFGPPNPYAGTTFNYSTDTKTTIWGTNLTVDWRLSDSLALYSITSYREFDSRWAEDNDVSPLSGSLGAEHMDNESFSQELRLNGKLGNVIDYTVGAYYFDQTTTYRTHQFLPYAVPGFEFLGNDPVDASSYAGFANISWRVTDALNVNAGVRYTKEEKTYHYSRLPVGGSITFGLEVLNGNPGVYEGDNVDYRLIADYRWNESLMTYASVSTAFKGGGTNARPFNPAQVVPFDKEQLTAYEIGAKTDFFDRRLRVNAAVFFNSYDDIQLTLLSCPQLSPGPCAATFNAGDADVKGAELEIEAHPIDGLLIDASWSKLNFEYTRLAPNTGLTLGQTAPGTIEDKFSIGVQYEWNLADSGSITPRIDYAYQGGFNTNAVFAPSNRVSGYGLTNVRVTWRSADSSWEASLIGSNLTDEEYFISNFDLLSSSGAQYGMIGAPREYAIQFQKRF